MHYINLYSCIVTKTKPSTREAYYILKLDYPWRVFETRVYPNPKPGLPKYGIPFLAKDLYPDGGSAGPDGSIPDRVKN